MTETYDASLDASLNASLNASLDDARLLVWLRAAGIAAIVAAAVGSVHFAAPSLPDQPSTGISEVSAP